jgi:hypothetical protein
VNAVTRLSLTTAVYLDKMKINLFILCPWLIIIWFQSATPKSQKERKKRKKRKGMNEIKARTEKKKIRKVKKLTLTPPVLNPNADAQISPLTLR